jgi:ribosomal protein S18 acetylase RimI-like enzyme
MYDIIEITENNNYLLHNFLNNNIPSTFRYFNKRTIDVIKNHIITIILLVDNISVGYAHIDLYDDKHWFGICILDKYQGSGYGKKIMHYIFNNEKIKNIDEIYLTVNKINTFAIRLYTTFHFYNIDEEETYYKMLRKNNILLLHG